MHPQPCKVKRRSNYPTAKSQQSKSQQASQPAGYQLIPLHQPHAPRGLIHAIQLLALGPLDNDIVPNRLVAEKALQGSVCLYGAERLGKGFGDLGGDTEGSAFGVVQGGCVVYVYVSNMSQTIKKSKRDGGLHAQSL